MGTGIGIDLLLNYAMVTALGVYLELSRSGEITSSQQRIVMHCYDVIAMLSRRQVRGLCANFFVCLRGEIHCIANNIPLGPLRITRCACNHVRQECINFERGELYPDPASSQ